MSEYLTVPLAAITVGGNIRLAGAGAADDRDLTDSIMEHGLLQPVIVRGCLPGRGRAVGR